MKTIKWTGKPISEPGIYSNIDIERYHSADICAGPSISSSGLRKITQESPAHFFASWRGNPKAAERKESRHFIIGRAAHHLHLGQENFSTLFAVQPEEYEDEKTGEVKPWNNNATPCKRWHAVRRKENKSVLTVKEAEQVVAMAERLHRNPIVAHGALNGLVERSLFWKDPKTGIWLKARPDTIPTSSGDVIDYKTTTSVVWTDLVRTIFDYGYFQQGALIRDAFREVLGIDKDFSFSLVFQEKQDPYAVRVVTMKENDLALGAKTNRIALDKFAACLKSGVWLGPGEAEEDAEPIEMSDYAHKALEDYIIINGGKP